MLLLLFLLVSATAKCAVWREFNRNKESDGPHIERACRSCDSSYAYTFSYGFESLDKQPVCNDIGMLEQCNRAQLIYDLFNTANSLPIVNLGCGEHVACVVNFDSNGLSWCQNMDSFDLCQSVVAAIGIRSVLFPVRCVKEEPRVDGIPISEYRRPMATTTTTTTTTTTVTTTTDPNATFAVTTTAPSSETTPSSIASIVTLCLSLMILWIC